MATTTTPGMTPNSEDRQRIQFLTHANRLLIGAVVLMAITAAAIGTWATMDSGPGDEWLQQIEATREIADALDVAVESTDAGSVAQFFAEDAFYEDPASGMAVTGRSAIEATFMGFLSSESPIENTAIFVGPGFTVTEFTWTQPCTFAACSAELFGEPVDVRGIVLQIVEDGMVTRETDYIAYPRNLLLP